MEEINITQVSPDDAQGIQNLLKESSKGMYLFSGYSEEDFEDRFKEFLSEVAVQNCAKNIRGLTESDKYFVAKNSDKIVGLCYGRKEKNKNILHAIYVKSEFQGVGLGKKLLDMILDFFDKSKDTTLEVFAQNVNAIKFYKKFGFIDTGKRIEDERFKSKSGTKVQEIEMVLKGKSM